MSRVLSNSFILLLLVSLFSCGPMARFTVNQIDSEAPAAVEFENESKKADRYEWNFGDGDVSSEPEPSHNYYLSGKYTVELKAFKNNKSRSTTKEIVVDAPDACLVIVETSFGNMVIELFDETPLHRDNFIKLAESGFYDGLLFHRVMDGFMIQGGDPQSKDAKPGQQLGSGGPGYQIPAEINKNLVHLKGALAAARQPDNVNPQKKSSGSQFYIVDGKPIPASQLKDFELSKGIIYSAEQKSILIERGGYPPLDMEYTVFGQVIEGLEVIDAIAASQRDRFNRPNEDVVMKVRVIK